MDKKDNPGTCKEPENCKDEKAKQGECEENYVCCVKDCDKKDGTKTILNCLFDTRKLYAFNVRLKILMFYMSIAPHSSVHFDLYRICISLFFTPR